jgi:hypothetical protein
MFFYTQQTPPLDGIQTERPTDNESVAAENSLLQVSFGL